jgi:ribosomal-protein-alanine N-acetyltransferase
MWELRGRRVVLRPLRTEDFEQWSAVKKRSEDWLAKWHPTPPPGAPDPVSDAEAFAARCAAQDRMRDDDMAYLFGMFEDDVVVGEAGLNFVVRGPFQNAFLSAWVDQDASHRGLVPEACVLVFQLAFEQLGLHRVEGTPVTTNRGGNRVCEKLRLRFEGVAERYFETNGEWLDHNRYAITVEEWKERRVELLHEWIES